MNWSNDFSSAYELGILAGHSLACIVCASLASLGDSFIWPSFRAPVIIGLIGVSGVFKAMENKYPRFCTAALVYAFGLRQDSITIIVALLIMLHFNLPPYIRYMSFEGTDPEFRGESLGGVILVGFYVCTVLYINHAHTIWSFIWHTLVFGLPSIIFSYQIWSRIVSQRRKEFLSYHFLRLVLCIYQIAAYGLISSLETSKALLDAIIAFFNRLETLFITSQQRNMYCYEPLSDQHSGTHPKTTTRSIRLLKLLRRKPFTEMECKLEIVNIDDTPSYEAISYTWRGEKPSIKIIVDNATLQVTPAIYEMLRYRHTFTGTKTFWIDSISINQEDTSEKNRQVALMKEIYRRASRVVVWLGPQKEAQDAHLAIEMLMTIIGRTSLLSNSSDHLYREIIMKNNPAWNSLVRLFKHPWFSRVWVVQEVAVGRIVHVMYGNVCIEWDALAAGIEILDNSQLSGAAQVIQPPSDLESPAFINPKHLANQFQNAIVIAKIRKTAQSFQSMTLKRVLFLCDWLQATKRHDKIYAMLGIVYDRLPDYMAIDYSKPESKVYEDTMRYLLSRPNTAGEPHVLQTAGTGWPRSPDMETSKLPSWVTDWSSSSPNHWLGVQSETWSRRNPRSTDNLPVVQFVDGKCILKVEAVKMDKIRCLGTIHWGTRNGSVATGTKNCAAWLQDAKSMAQSSHDALRTPKEFPYASFWRTLTGGADHGMFPELSSSPPAKLLAALEAFWELSLRLVNPGSISDAERLTVTKQIIEMSATITPLSYHIGAHCWGNLFCVTDKGHFALVPPRTNERDSIYFLRGIQSPFILREILNLGETSAVRYELVGSCYVDGMMEGSRGEPLWEGCILE